MIKIDLSQKIGEFKPINGIDNGPVCFGSLIDSSYYYKQAGFPYCRLHDTNYPHPREVDIPAIFKDFSADENDPGNYDFRATDIYLNQIIDTGAKIIYRLGVSIEHPKLKYYVEPPSDSDKWARICLNIARHYNEGWADGFNMGIDYWEVWNEPDMLTEKRGEDTMWSGTPRQYFELYAATSRLFKKEMPYANIGGYAAAWLPTNFFTDFLQYVKDNGLPLDFFSWHIYTTSIEAIKNNANHVRETLGKYGFANTKTVLDEWNYISWNNLWGGIFDRTEKGSNARHEQFTETSGETGASFTASAFIAMLDLPIDIATFYDGSPTNIFGTIFDRYGVPTKQYYAFDAFNKMKQSGKRVKTECDINDIYVTAAASEDNKKAAVLIANYNSSTGHYYYDMEWSGNNNGDSGDNAEYLYELYLIDKHRTFEKVDEKVCTSKNIPNSVFLHQHSVALICLTNRTLL